MRIYYIASLCALLTGCGGSGNSKPSTVAPAAPLNLAINVGDGAISLGWNPPASDGGAAVDSYEVTLNPAVPTSAITFSGTGALVGNLSNGTAYTVSVRARNRVGAGQAVSASVVPRAITTAGYSPITIQGDDSPSGVYDPSILRLTSGELWLSYSSVNYYNNANSQLVQDVGIRLAYSADGGNTFTYSKTIAAPTDSTVTDTDPARSACGAATCSGRWVYETSWLIDDSTDPDPARRFKLFAHKYFLNPAGTARTLYHLGSIVMWTASAPDQTWSAETSLLGWFLTPPELVPAQVVNSLHADLANCIVVAEGSATVRDGSIDLVFACTYPGGDPLPQKIVMLRSADHLDSLQYVSTLLTPADAVPIGASFFSAPALMASPGSAPALLVTPSFSGVYAGCVVIPLADPAGGTLFRANNLPVGILYTPPIQGHFGGACTYSAGLGNNGILQSDGAAGTSPAEAQFKIQATQAVLQP